LLPTVLSPPGAEPPSPALSAEALVESKRPRTRASWLLVMLPDRSTKSGIESAEAETGLPSETVLSLLDPRTGGPEFALPAFSVDAPRRAGFPTFGSCASLPTAGERTKQINRVPKEAMLGEARRGWYGSGFEGAPGFLT